MTRRRWWAGGALGLLAVLAVAAGAAWYAQSALARWLAIRQLTAVTGRHAAIDRLDLDLRRGRLAITGVRLADRAPGPPLAEIDRVDVRFDSLALLRGRTVIHEAAVVGVRARIVRSERGELNIADLLGGATHGGAPDVALGQLTLTGGAVSLEDRTRAPAHTWRADAIALELSQLSTLGGDAGHGRITAAVAGAPVSADLAELRLRPLRLRGRLALRDVDATFAGLYLPADGQGVLDGARVTADVAVELDAREGVALDADGRLEGVALGHRRTGGPLAEVPALSFTVSGARADASGRVTQVGRIEVTGGATLYGARGDGARLGVDRLRLRIVGVERAAEGAARLSLSAGLPDGGAVDVQGPVRLAPFGAELRARVTRLDPAVLLSYADLPVSLTGVVEGDLAIDVASAHAVSARIRGRAAVTRAAASSRGVPVASVARIELDGIETNVAPSSPPRISVARVRVVQPVATVARDAAGRTSIADRVPAPAATAPAGAASGTASPSVEIAEIVVDDGTIIVDDAAARPPARLTVSKLRGSARQAAWPGRGPVAIDLQAATPGAGTLSAQGTVSLDPLRLDVRARLSGAALAPYQGYVPFPGGVQGLAHADVAVTGALSPTVEVRVKGMASLTDLRVSDGDRRVMRVSRVETTGLDYAWPSTLAVDRLRVGRSWVRVERQPDGTLPILALFTPAPAASAAGQGVAGPSAAPAFSVTVREAILDEGAARITDATVTPAARIDLTGVRLAAQAFAWPARGPMPIDLRVGTPGGGSASARGALNLAAGSIDVKVTLAGVDLAPARPYAPLRGQITGKASGDLEITARLDPLAIAVRGDAVLADLTVAQGDGPVVAVARAETKGLDYTWPTKLAIERLRVQKPRAVIERRRDGTWPILTMLTPPASAPGAEATVRAEASANAGGERSGAGGSGAAMPPLELSIREGVLEDGSAVLSDAAVSPPARLEVNGLRLGARDVSWPWRRPASVWMRVPMPGGGTVRARGQVAAGGAGLELDVTADGVDVAPVRPYLPLRGDVTGKVAAQLKVGATLEPLALTARGTASLADLAVVDGGRRLLTAARAEVTGLDYTWPATLAIDRLRVQKPWALVDRVSGKVPVLDALASTSTGSSAGHRPVSAPAVTSPGPQLSVRRSVMEDGAVTILDTGVSPPAQIELGGARLTLRDLAWPTRQPAGFTVRATAGDGATIEARGQLGLEPSGIDTTLAIAGMDLATFQPFVPGRARIAGRATADLRVKGPLAPLDLSITGQMTLTDASLGDRERTLATAKRIDLAGLAAEWPRARAVVQRVAVREPWALVERDASGELPLLSLIAMGRADAAAPGPVPAANERGPAPAAARRNDVPSLQVATLAVEEGFVRFIDAATTPRFVEEASRLTVTVLGFGTAPSARSQLAVSARLTGGAQVELSGIMGPVGGPLLAEATGKLSGLPLNRVNPYVGGLLGWVARQGSVNGTTQFRIRDDYLEADNEVVIARPVFVPTRRGDEVRKRVGVPLDMLVSLMKNAQDEVRLTVPVTGRLSSREFDFGDAVWDAIRKVAINVLALPVSWVGKIFYTADARIDTIAIWPVSFEPGTTRMRRGIDGHAARLATFMRDTPAIAFALKPVMTVEDADAIKREAVRQRLATLAGAAGQPDAAAGAAKLFAERFPGRPVPGELDALISELAKEEPSPDSGLRALAAQRLEVTRRELVGKGVDPARLRPSDGTVPVEASGAGRVEFEMIPLVVPAS